MRILLTGFEPFGQETVNPSWEAVSAFPETVYGAEIVKVRLPVSFKGATVMLEDAIKLYTPDVVLSVGQSGGRFDINIERVALNMADSTKPDNDGYQPIDIPIRQEAPEAYFSNLPLKQMKEAVCARGVPAVISNSAGLYVCNSVFYTAMHLVHSKYPDMRAGFIHIPYLPCQTVSKSKQPSMSSDTVIQALEAIIQVIAPDEPLV